MTTQTLRTQTNATIGRQEQVEAGRLANFIETGKKLLGAQFNTNHTRINYSAKATLQHKAEIDAYLNGVGLV
jgi:hypothetical protein